LSSLLFGFGYLRQVIPPLMIEVCALFSPSYTKIFGGQGETDPEALQTKDPASKRIFDGRAENGQKAPS